ncbi:MAG: hypothetical protein RL376_277, partial [Verrucomicrobiota bacterium]
MNSFKNVFHRVRSSLRIQLILGVAGVHAVLMGVFTWDLTVKQRLAWREVQFAENSALTKSLAINSANWLSVRDLGGLQELVEALAAGHSEIRYVMVMDTSGQVLAHSQSQHRSKFIQGLPTRPDGLVNNRDEREGHTDLLFPVLLEEGQLTGWVKLGFAEERLRGMQRETAIWGLTYVFLSIVIGTLLAYLLARKLTARLYQLRAISAQVGAGHKLIQAPDLGSDEIGQLGRDFNAMLSALNNAQGRLEQTVTQRTASLETALRDLQSREASDARLKSLLFTLHQINQLCLQAGDTQALLAEACSTMVTRMGYERVTISRINPDGQELVRLASAGLAHGAALLPEEAAALVNLPPNLNGRLWCYRLNLAENGRGVLSIGLPENYTAHAEEPRILRMIAADLAVALRNLENLRALNQQREFAQLVLDHIEVGVVVSDPDGQLLLVNQAARIWLNVTDAELPLPEWPAHAQFQAVQGRAPLLAGESPLTLALKGQSTNQLDLILSRENAPQLRIRADAA